jgi:hypothetical protein
MSFSRIKYDQNSYDLKLDRATGPGDYRLFKGNSENCGKCYSNNGSIGSKNDISVAGDSGDNQWAPMADLESKLTNRVNKLSDGNEYGKNDDYKNYPVFNKTECSNNMISQDTRFTNPIEAYRCMDNTEYHYTPFLFVNPQCEIQGDRIGLNSRLRVKDTYKIHIPSPIDQSNILPPPNSNVVDMCKN